MKTKKQYKIRRKSDGLFSTGGQRPAFDTKGKAWTNVGHVKTHIAGIRESHQWMTRCGITDPVAHGFNAAGVGVYDDCELVTYEVVFTETGAEPMGPLLDGYR